MAICHFRVNVGINFVKCSKQDNVSMTMHGNMQGYLLQICPQSVFTRDKMSSYSHKIQAFGVTLCTGPLGHMLHFNKLSINTYTDFC